MLKKKHILLPFCIITLFLYNSCSKSSVSDTTYDLQSFLQTSQEDLLTSESRFTIINQVSNKYLAEKKHTELILFLTDHVEQNPDDIYNAYWLLMVAYSYMEKNETPIAEYYFDRILNNYDDLLVKGSSIHFLCLKNLIQICDSSENRIVYFTKLISQFPEQINLTEAYAKLATEYEKLGEWEQMINCYSLFRKRPDATTIQISGLSNIYEKASEILDFNTSAKDWSFATLEELENAVRKAILSRNYKQLDNYKSKVNFFIKSWKQDDSDNSRFSFSMSSVMRGTIRCSETLDETSNPNEAYLRTWGWQQSVSVWYFYFRKINFPLDPDVHGRWEWAGIYFGEKL